MAHLIIGVDPDSKKHGIAIYEGGALVDLLMWDISGFLSFIELHRADNLKFVIEDVKKNRAVYRQHSSSKSRIQGEIGRCLGLVQQAQIDLERVLDHFGITYRLIPPMAGNWAETAYKAQFTKCTGWTRRSNKETRSAAFFGYLEAVKWVGKK